jgi:ribose transport system ATP-binding protein
MNGFVVEMSGISKSFTGVGVLHEVNLDLKEEVLGLVGKNGAGKSTLMKILFGVERADRGSIRVLEDEFESARSIRGQNRNIAMIFQEFSLIPTLTVAENIFLNNLQKNKIGFLDKERCRRDAAEILTSLHVNIDPDFKVQALSVAEKQSVEIAKALSENKKIVIMDEPTAALSSDQVDFLFGVIRKLKSQGISIIYISHNLRQIFEICDRISVIRDGRNVLTSRTEDTDLEGIIGGITGISQTLSSWRVSIEKKEGEKERKSVPLLSVENLACGNKVHGVSFDVFPNEVVGLAGLTGSGRTEILESIYGVYRFQSGAIGVRGSKLKRLSPDRALKRGLILIPDERQVKGLVLSHSVMSNMILPVLKRMKRTLFLNMGMCREFAQELVDKLKVVTSGLEQRVSSLSGGNQQKVVLSKAVSTSSNVLLLDDPTLGIDVQSKQEIAKLIREYVSAGENAALFVSSELEIVSDVCDRVLVLRDGKIVAELSRKRGDDLSESKLLSLV